MKACDLLARSERGLDEAQEVPQMPGPKAFWSLFWLRGSLLARAATRAGRKILQRKVRRGKHELAPGDYCNYKMRRVPDLDLEELL